MAEAFHPLRLAATNGVATLTTRARTIRPTNSSPRRGLPLASTSLTTLFQQTSSRVRCLVSENHLSLNSKLRFSFATFSLRLLFYGPCTLLQSRGFFRPATCSFRRIGEQRYLTTRRESNTQSGRFRMRFEPIQVAPQTSCFP